MCICEKKVLINVIGCIFVIFRLFYFFYSYSSFVCLFVCSHTIQDAKCFSIRLFVCLAHTRSKVLCLSFFFVCILRASQKDLVIDVFGEVCTLCVHAFNVGVRIGTAIFLSLFCSHLAIIVCVCACRGSIHWLDLAAMDACVYAPQINLYMHIWSRRTYIHTPRHTHDLI